MLFCLWMELKEIILRSDISGYSERHLEAITNKLYNTRNKQVRPTLLWLFIDFTALLWWKTSDALKNGMWFVYLLEYIFQRMYNWLNYSRKLAHYSNYSISNWNKSQKVEIFITRIFISKICPIKWLHEFQHERISSHCGKF
jgi:hypothetical protein